jgi:hypothetical protein
MDRHYNSMIIQIKGMPCVLVANRKIKPTLSKIGKILRFLDGLVEDLQPERGNPPMEWTVTKINADTFKIEGRLAYGYWMAR